MPVTYGFLHKVGVLKKDVHNADSSVQWTAGMHVKCVMESRLGDIGITNNLAAEYGYQIRVNLVWVDKYITWED